MQQAEYIPDEGRAVVRVYLLPAQLTNGYCFRGGVPIAFTNVDWFSAGSDEGPDTLVPFIKGKRRRAGKCRRVPDEPNPIVSCGCGCGCGGLFKRFDAGGRPRNYITGRNVGRNCRGQFEVQS